MKEQKSHEAAASMGLPRVISDRLISAVASTRPLEQRMAACERCIIEFALQQNEQNVTHAARMLGMGRSTLNRKLREYGIREADPRFRTKKKVSDG